MIDEKKIETAAKETFVNVRNSKDNVCMKVGFLSGVKWFKEAIWHDAKEEPEEHKFIVTQWLHEGEICYEADRKQPKVDWQQFINDSIHECMRVLADFGVLIFKWNEQQIKVNDVLNAITDYRPVFGHRTTIKNNTIWMAFMKMPKGGKK